MAKPVGSKAVGASGERQWVDDTALLPAAGGDVYVTLGASHALSAVAGGLLSRGVGDAHLEGRAGLEGTLVQHDLTLVTRKPLPADADGFVSEPWGHQARNLSGIGGHGGLVHEHRVPALPIVALVSLSRCALVLL